MNVSTHYHNDRPPEPINQNVHHATDQHADQGVFRCPRPYASSSLLLLLLLLLIIIIIIIIIIILLLLLLYDYFTVKNWYRSPTPSQGIGIFN